MFYKSTLKAEIQSRLSSTAEHKLDGEVRWISGHPHRCPTDRAGRHGGALVSLSEPLSDPGPSPRERVLRPDLFQQILPFIPELKGYLRRRVAAHDVEDVIQDVFLRLARRDESAKLETPKRYLYQVARAALIDRHRRDLSRHASQHCELSDVNQPVEAISPLRVLEGREDIRAARVVLAAMPQRRREILVAVRLEGCSLKVVAARYGISTKAVEKHLSRAFHDLCNGVPADDRATRRLRSPRAPALQARSNATQDCASTSGGDAVQ